jgi:hypothetical protein
MRLGAFGSGRASGATAYLERGSRERLAYESLGVKRFRLMSDREPEKDRSGAQEPGLPEHYYLDESDPDVLVLRRQDGTFVAAFSAQGATKEGIVEAAKEDYYAALMSKGGGGEEGPDPAGDQG